MCGVEYNVSSSVSGSVSGMVYGIVYYGSEDEEWFSCFNRFYHIELKIPLSDILNDRFCQYRICGSEVLDIKV